MVPCLGIAIRENDGSDACRQYRRMAFFPGVIYWLLPTGKHAEHVAVHLKQIELHKEIHRRGNSGL